MKEEPEEQMETSSVAVRMPTIHRLVSLILTS